MHLRRKQACCSVASDSGVQAEVLDAANAGELKGGCARACEYRRAQQGPSAFTLELSREYVGAQERDWP
jgi:hypothetical protein